MAGYPAPSAQPTQHTHTLNFHGLQLPCHPTPPAPRRAIALLEVEGRGGKLSPCDRQA